jgi:hypothetical protein
MTTPSTSNLTEPLRRALEERRDVSCVLNSELRITYCNPAWDRFALENQGERALSRHVLGTSVLDVSGDALQRFYRNMFEAVASSGKPFDFDYECSSAERFRMFRMHVLPLKGASGFLVVHSLRLEWPHSRTPSDPERELYRDSRGLIVMCSHCRRTRRANDPAAWDWVPQHLTDSSLEVSHGLCQVCHAYYYPEFVVPPGQTQE